jgi:hypothetical protein
MPDISMCESDTCPKSKTCYRHEDSGTKPSEFRQSYFIGNDPDNCKYYWPVKGNEDDCKKPRP